MKSIRYYHWCNYEKVLKDGKAYKYLTIGIDVNKAKYNKDYLHKITKRLNNIIKYYDVIVKKGNQTNYDYCIARAEYKRNKSDSNKQVRNESFDRVDRCYVDYIRKAGREQMEDDSIWELLNKKN